MDLKDFKYRATFMSTASLHVPSETEVKTAVASLDGLRNLLPADVDPTADPDLLYISANGAVGGLCNKNGDAVSNETALAVYGSSKNKYISVEHDRDHGAIGVILYPGLTRFGSNEALTPEVAATLKEPFNMAFAGVLWKVMSPMIAKYIVKEGGTEGQDALSMSWEIAFNSFDIGVGSRNIFEAKVVKADDPTFSTFEKCLRQNGGKGTDASGKEVFRIINGDAIVLGYSIVPNPAAEVKGILPIEKAAPAVDAALAQINDILNLSNEKLTEFGTALFKVAKERGLTFENAAQAIVTAPSLEVVPEKSAESSITSSNASVTPNTTHSMKIETLEQLESNWTEIRKLESAASVADFVKAIKQGSEKYAADLKAQEDLLKNAEQAKAENEKRAKELQASLDTVKKELADVRASQEALQTNQKFQERMASFDEKFDLDDEDRQLIAADIKGLDDDSFAAYAKKCDKLMASKAKKAKKDDKKDEKPGDKKKDNEPDDDDDDDDAKAAEAKAALASVKELEGQAKVPNAASVDEDVLKQMTSAFSLKIDGQTVEERKAARAAKSKK